MLRRAVTIAHIGPTALRAHWTLAPALLALALAVGPLYFDTLPGAAALAVGLGMALSIYGAVLLHELGHALAARAVGLPAQAITLFGFGGRTEVDESALRPLDELRVALAGPLVSAALAASWGLAAWALPAGQLQTAALAQAAVNFGLLTLNLMPGYPLDGGRVLKASLWFLMDDEMRAARLGMLIARACGWALLVVGVVCAVAAGGVVVGSFIGMSGYFLSRTAAAGFQQLSLQRALRGVRVEDVMQRAFRAVEPDMPLDQFVGRFIIGQSDPGFPVLAWPDADAPQPLLGMITLRDLRRFSLSQWNLTRVGEAMTPAGRVAALSPDTSADDALRALVESGEELLPVVAGESLLGIVRRSDLVWHIRRRMARLEARR